MDFIITGSQHDRIDGKTVLVRPQGLEQFQELKRKSVADLKALGCGVWTETPESYHMLYPLEWYDDIPAGLEMLCISGRTEKFVHGQTDNDTRFGMLAFGFLVPKDV